MSSFLNPVKKNRRLIAVTAYGVVAFLSYVSATFVRFEFSLTQTELTILQQTVLSLVAIRILTSLAFRVSDGRWRYAGTADVLRLAAATFIGTAIIYVLSWHLRLIPPIPRSVILLEWVFTTYGTAGMWIVYRVLIERARRAQSGPISKSKRVLIVGAGEAGSLLVREMLRGPTGYRPVGFIDDDPAKYQTTVHGVPVVGNTAHLPVVARDHQVEEIVIAAPSALPAELRRIVEQCEVTQVRFKVLPGIARVIAGDVRLTELRELRIEDLLGREPIQLQLPELYEDLSDEVVLITGAAGSIGSELSRQVAMHAPRALILLDQAETPLFFLEHQLRLAHPTLTMVFIVGNVVDEATVVSLFESYRPTRVYHAAAYKHVPMMQYNCREAIRNNVLGTLRVAKAATQTQTEKFVLVSTDKAVRPTSIMGVSKRLAEIAVLELQAKYPDTAFASVRFGNVLGSNGSVIPLFKQQIESGKPLTVTHKDCTRYFMTIPEAVHLILQASLLPELRGRIAMLEMGEPIKILELAKNLLRLSGLPVRENENILFTGLRAGEKLHEELFAPDEQSEATSVEKVRLVVSSVGAALNLNFWFQNLDEWLAETSELDALSFVRALFPTLEQTSPLNVPHARPAHREPAKVLASPETAR